MKNLWLGLIGVLILSLAVYLLAQPNANRVQAISDNIVKPYLTENNIPGAAIGIYYNGKAYFFNYGVQKRNAQKPITINTIFEIASVTKVFTSTLLAIEIENGTLTLDSPITQYMPGFAETKDLPINQVTVKDLATHTASFPRDINGFGVKRGDLSGLLVKLKTWQPKYPIGTKFVYSNISFGLLGYVVQNAAHSTYQTLLSKNILQPLGMQDTFINVPKNKYLLQAQGYNKFTNDPAPFFSPTIILGGGELRSSSYDLMQFLQANLGIKTGKATDTLIQAMQLAQKPYFQVKPTFQMGLGWQNVTLDGEKIITKDGANQGFNSFIAFSPSKKMGVIVLVNKNGVRVTKVGRQILAALFKLS